MLRRILVPLDLSPYAEEATRRACELAKAHRAQVTGMTVLDTPDIAAADIPFHAMLASEGLKLADDRLEDAQQRIDEGMKKFAERCEAAGVPHNECEYQGVPSNCILKAANFYDLVVMGLRTYFHFETQSESGDSLEQVLNRTIVPVLAVPKHGQPGFEKVLLAYDGSAPATRALRALAAFEPAGELEVTILMSSKDPEAAKFYLGNAAAFLRAHRFDKVETVTTDRHIREAIEEDYMGDVDLVVAGMHSKHAIKDFFIGSLAQQLIEYGHTPLLLGQ